MKYLCTSFYHHWKEIVEDTEMKTENLWEDGSTCIRRMSRRWGRHHPVKTKAKNLSVGDLWLLATPSDWEGVTIFVLRYALFLAGKRHWGNVDMYEESAPMSEVTVKLNPGISRSTLPRFNHSSGTEQWHWLITCSVPV